MTRQELLDRLRETDPSVTIDPEIPIPDEESGFIFVQTEGGPSTLADFYRDGEGNCCISDEQADILADWLDNLKNT
ncbi:MAG: hypothetical protein ACRD2H_09595 [Terriglobales bacterium]